MDLPEKVSQMNFIPRCETVISTLLSSYLYKTAPYQQSVPEWKKTLQRNVKQIKMLAAATKEERKNELKKRYHLYLDSYLARDIFECVSKNEWILQLIQCR